MEDEGLGPGVPPGLAIGERTQTRSPSILRGPLVCVLSPIAHAAEGGTQPSPPWNSMSPMLKKPAVVQTL